jgi:hypothetical protein
MVKLFGRTFFEKKKAEEKFKASVDVGFGGKPKRKIFNLGENSWASRCQHFDKFAQDYPLFNEACLSLAGLGTAQGIFYSPAVNKNDETYTLAEEALWRIQKIDRDQRVNAKFYETIYRMAKHGGAFWEVSFTPSFGFRVIPFQEFVEPLATDDVGEIIRWREVMPDHTQVEWPTEPSQTDAYIVPVMWNVTSATWPYGTSLGTGVETELETLIDLITNANAYMERQAYPYEILALGNEKTAVGDSDYATAKNEWKNRKPGEGLATRNMPVAIIPGGTGSTPIRELAVLGELMKDNLHDGLMVPPISKLYNSTEASATVLTQHVMTTLGQPIQWIIKEQFEEYVLKPYLEYAGFSRKSCPNVLFESPDVHKKEEGEYWTGLVSAKIQTPQQACEHLGLEYDEAYWTEQQEVTMKNQQKQQQQPKQTEEVWEVRKKSLKL